MNLSYYFSYYPMGTRVTSKTTTITRRSYDEDVPPNNLIVIIMIATRSSGKKNVCQQNTCKEVDRFSDISKC
jgi:hypothetical protein